MTGVGNTLLYEPIHSSGAAKNAALGIFGCAFTEVGATGHIFVLGDPRLEDNAALHGNLSRYVGASSPQLSCTGESITYAPIARINTPVETEDASPFLPHYVSHVLCHEWHWPLAHHERPTRWVDPGLALQGHPAEPWIVTVAYGGVQIDDPPSATSGDREEAASTPSTASQRLERKATAALVTSIQNLVPGYSEGDLAKLVGVTRVAWRDWQKGRRATRSRNRRQLLKLKAILQLRQRTAPMSFLAHWLDTPVGRGLTVTPAQLLAEGKNDLVAILAARAPTPEGDELTLERPLDLGGLIDSDRVADELDMAATYSSEPESDDKDM